MQNAKTAFKKETRKEGKVNEHLHNFNRSLFLTTYSGTKMKQYVDEKWDVCSTSMQMRLTPLNSAKETDHGGLHGT